MRQSGLPGAPFDRGPHLQPAQPPLRQMALTIQAAEGGPFVVWLSGKGKRPDAEPAKDREALPAEVEAAVVARYLAGEAAPGLAHDAWARTSAKELLN